MSVLLLENLLQTALVRGFHNLHQLREDAAFKVWQSRILVRAHLNRHRGRPDPAGSATSCSSRHRGSVRR